MVMVIAAILAAIAGPQLLEQRRDAYRTALKADLRNAVLEIDTRMLNEPGGFTTLTNPYLHSANGMDWQGSAGVNINMANNPPATATTYCLRASHDRLPGETWRFKRGVDSAPRQLNCNA